MKAWAEKLTAELQVINHTVCQHVNRQTEQVNALKRHMKAESEQFEIRNKVWVFFAQLVFIIDQLLHAKVKNIFLMSVITVKMKILTITLPQNFRLVQV